MMPFRCIPCNKSFNRQSDLDQHLRDSPKHKSTARNPPSTIPSGPSVSGATKPAVQTLPQGAKAPWSRIAEGEYATLLNDLSAHCHSMDELEERGYIVRPYNLLDYADAGVCTQCRCKQRHIVSQQCVFHPSKRNKWNKKKPYKCCNAITGGGGCRILPAHDFQPPQRALTHRDFRHTPGACAELKFRAVTLDCEMAGIAGGGSEVILLCATDFVTGAVLINRFVCPSVAITDTRTRIHGIKKSTLDQSIAQGQALAGWEGARSELWKYIDDRTILVGHALEHDLGALRMIHPRVVDSSILTEVAVGARHVRFGLHKLSSELPGIEIREGKEGFHDCMEDVLATREVVLFCTRARSKTAFKSWAESEKRKQMRLAAEREARREKANRRHRTRASGGGGNSGYTFESDDEYEEHLRWSDIAEDCGWPHPDTGYDPWSD